MHIIPPLGLALNERIDDLSADLVGVQHSCGLGFELVNGRQIWGRRLHSHP